MKKIVSIVFVSLFALGIVLLAGLGFMQYRNQKVKKIVVHIHRNGSRGFLNEKEIKSLVQKHDTVIGKTVKAINIKKIEKDISGNPYVKAVDVFLNIFGNLRINVTEKTPMLQVYNLQDKSCYIDMNGNLFPLSPSFAPRVLPANGYIRTRLVMGKNIRDKMYRKTTLPELYLLAKKIWKNELLKANTSQLFVNSKGNIDMVPELGRYVIHFGDSANMDVKLENLEAFTRQVFARGVCSKYSSIQLEYTNQIVCTKK